MQAGSEDYRAYVGPPERYDVLAALQFSLLAFLGLREFHCLLDVGCGSLRAGRLFIPYLLPERYFAIEPNRWLIEQAIACELGHDLIALKRPRFAHNDDFNLGVFGVTFDFILAQSIFSHTGLKQLCACLRSTGEVLAADGLLVATFVESKQDAASEGWVYPGLNRFAWATIKTACEQSGLVCAKIDWPHPLQTWFVAARQQERLTQVAQRGIDFVPNDLILTGHRYRERKAGRFPCFYYRGTGVNL